MLQRLKLYYADVSDKFNVYFVFGYAYFMRLCLKTAIWSFLAFLGQGLGIFGEHRLATLLDDCTTEWLLNICPEI